MLDDLLNILFPVFVDWTRSTRAGACIGGLGTEVVWFEWRAGGAIRLEHEPGCIDRERLFQAMEPASQSFCRSTAPMESCLTEYAPVYADGKCVAVFWFQTDGMPGSFPTDAPEWNRDFLCRVARLLRDAHQVSTLQQENVRYRLLELATYDTTYEWDLVTGKIRRNQAYQRFCSPTEPAGFDCCWWEDHLHPDDREAVLSEMQRVFGEGEIDWSRRYRFRRHDGRYSTVLDRAVVQRADDGTPLRMVGAISEITDWFSTEGDSTVRDQWVQHLIDANIVGVVLTSPCGSINAANDAFLDTLGYSRTDLESGLLNWQKLTPSEQPPVALQVREGLMTEGRAVPIETIWRHKDGTIVPVLVASTFLDVSKGKGISLVVDISARYQAEAERRARLAVEATSLGKARSVAQIAHDLRTPLNAVMGLSDLLLNQGGLLNEKQRKYVRTIYDAGDHMLQLVVDMLDHARKEFSQCSLRLRPFSLEACLQRIDGIVQNLACIRGLNYRRSEAPYKITLLGDEVRLRQVLLNLLANAVKFTDHGEVSLTVLAELTGENSFRISFDVTDTGVGIAPMDLESIFLPYGQVGDEKRRAEGTGLGLYICRDLIRLMGGEIRVRSELGVGSTFSFDIVLSCAIAAPRPASSLLPDDRYAPG